MHSCTQTKGISLVLMILVLGFWSAVAAGCRSAVDDFYKPLTGGPDSHCGGAGDAGAGGTTSTGSASGGVASTGGVAGNAPTGGASLGCSTGTGGGE